ncbi:MULTISPECIES: tyrosine-type recombinase/integrase [unclassified Paraflavitalea]|uniref:tyrosine-type recombinase/integrase n=1 Tax=unclassified Paraflavitalea TaxID=2798305 RepID=UPI003D340BB9
MKEVRIKVMDHRGARCIGIYFENYSSLNGLLRKKMGARWSQTHKCWYVGFSESNLQRLHHLLKEAGCIIIEEQLGKAGGMSRELSEKTERGAGYTLDRIYDVNKQVLEDVRQHLILKAYSPSTIRTYLNELHAFLGTIKDRDARSFTPDRIKAYLQYCFEKLNLSENTLHSRINALKFYYEQVLKREKFFWEIPRPKKPLQLPKLLNEDELTRLFNALQNKKHKAMLFTAYSAGLRVSEVVALELSDIDSKRMQMHIRNAKGKKDRYVNLSPVLLDILRRYIQECEPKPRKYLFESSQTGSSYPTRTIQQVFSNAKQKAGISKSVGIHSLRHSFATHLLDKGVDIRYIKDLLGHFDIRTTERYLHVSKKSLVNIVSPFDDLWKSNEIDW